MGNGQRWSKSQKWSYWSGDQTDLLALLGQMASESEKLRDAYVAEETKYQAQHVARLDSDCTCDDPDGSPYHLKDHASARAELEEAVQRAENAPALSVLVVNRDKTTESIAGDPAEVARIVDEQRATHLTITGAPFAARERFVVKFSRDDGASLNIDASRIEWAKLAFSEVAHAIQRRARGSWMRSWATLSVAAVAATAPICLAIISLFDLLVGGEGLDLASRTTIAFLTGGGLAVPLTHALRRFLAPGFELVRAGEAPSSRTRTRAIWGLLAWIAAIVIPMFIDS